MRIQFKTLLNKYVPILDIASDNFRSHYLPVDPNMVTSHIMGS